MNNDPAAEVRWLLRAPLFPELAEETATWKKVTRIARLNVFGSGATHKVDVALANYIPTNARYAEELNNHPTHGQEPTSERPGVRSVSGSSSFAAGSQGSSPDPANRSFEAGRLSQEVESRRASGAGSELSWYSQLAADKAYDDVLEALDRTSQASGEKPQKRNPEALDSLSSAAPIVGAGLGPTHRPGSPQRPPSGSSDIGQTARSVHPLQPVKSGKSRRI